MSTLLLSVAFALTPREPLPPMPLAHQAAGALAKGSPRLLVKLRDGQRADAVDGTLTPLIHHDVSALVARAEARSGRAQPDYGSLFLVATDGSGVQALGAALQADEDVEVVWSSPGGSRCPVARASPRRSTPASPT